MISPQDYDGVVLVRTLVQDIEQVTHAGIGKGIGGQTGLHRFLPFAALPDVPYVTVAHTFAGSGDIVKVIWFVGRKYDVFEWMQVEELLRGIPREMRQVDAATEEKRLVVIPLQELGRSVCGLPIGIGLDGMIGWSPVDQAGEDRVGFELGTKPVFVTFALEGWDGSYPVRGIDVIPRLRIGELAMGLVIELTPAPCEVAMLSEVLRAGSPSPCTGACHETSSGCRRCRSSTGGAPS